MDYSSYIYSDNQNTVIDISRIKKILERPYLKFYHKISLLNYDESVKSIIPNEDISLDGISYTEEYQQGQRRNITLKLINIEGKYTPSINNIWMDSKFSYEIGIPYLNEIIWFPKGIYVLGDINATKSVDGVFVTLQLKDKFSIFEDKIGTLDVAYEIPINSTIKDAIKGILNTSTENGHVFDMQSFILDSSFESFKTQATIRVDAAGTYGDVFKELATQMSAEYYYNEVGNLCFYPINETVDDSAKPIIWTYSTLDRDLHSLDLNYSNENIVNYFKVIGDNIDNGIFSAVVKNDNPTSPICIGRIGKRVSKITESNIWSNTVAEDLGKYYLRQSSCVNVQFSCPVSFNPILTVNNICEVEDNFFGLERDKLLINSISFTSGNGEMSLNLVNTKDLPF